MKTDLTLAVEHLTYKYLYLRRGYRLGMEVSIPWKLKKTVSVDLKIKGTPIVDIMGVSNRGIVVCAEVKTTLSDFKSNHGHNFYGHYNYYAVPQELVNKIKGLVPSHVGIISVNAELQKTEFGGNNTHYYYEDPRVVKVAKYQKIDFDQNGRYPGETLLEEVQYNIITAQTSTILTLTKNNLSKEKS